MRWIKILLVALGYFLLARLSFLTALPAAPSGPSLAWLATGFALIALMMEGYWILPGIFFGSLLNAYPSTSSPAGVAGFVTANTLDPLMAYWLIRKVLHRNLDPCKGRDITFFIFIVTCVSSVASALVGAGTMYFAGLSPIGNYGQTALVWWVSDFLGVLILVPLYLSWKKNARCVKPTAGKAESVLGWLVGIAMLAFIFRMPLGRETLHFVYWLIPFVIWLGFRMGQRGLTAGVFVMALAVVGFTSYGAGPFVVDSAQESFLYVQSFLAVISILGLLLTAAIGERESAIQDRDDFFLLASHELNTPISVLLMQSHFYNELLERGDKKALTEDQVKEMIRINGREVRRLAELAGDLLRGARAVAGKLDLERQDSDLREIALAAVREEAEAIQHSGSEVTVLGEAVRGSWDSPQLQFVVKALLKNALKYGEGKPVEILVGLNGGLALLKVSDQGAGIPKEVQARIFERFRQMDHLKFFGGLGQGLFLSKAIVGAHQGAIQVEGAPGKGTRFTVKLPLG